MSDVEDVVAELSVIMDRLLALPQDASTERYELLVRQQAVRDLAAEFRQDAEEERSTQDLLAELAALKRRRETLISMRTGFATGTGGNSAPDVWVKLRRDALAGGSLDWTNARIAKLEGLLAHVYEQYRCLVLGYCLRRTSRDDAYEATNEVFTVAWQRCGDLPSGDGTSPWLYGVARRVLSHRRRSASRLARLSGKAAAMRPPQPPGPEPVVVQRHEYDTVCRAVSDLRPDDREMVLLSAWEGLSHAEIARSMGYSLPEVDKRLARAKQRLKRRHKAFNALLADANPVPDVDNLPRTLAEALHPPTPPQPDRP